MVIAQSHKLIK